MLFGIAADMPKVDLSSDMGFRNGPVTYANQPDNLIAWRLGEACRKAADDPNCGDYIDRGLILLRELEARGLGIVRIPPAK
jgi:hypothetical protein